MSLPTTGHGEHSLKKRHVWTWVETEVLARFYADSRTGDLATALGVSAEAIYRKAMKMGLRKSREFVASEASGRISRGDHKGRQTQFKPGLVPWNTGLKGVCGVQEACRATQFKKGRPAHEARNYVPIGSLRLGADGNLERKVTDDPGLVPARRWVAVHRMVWQAAHGSIPAGHVVAFKAGRHTVVEAEITLDAVELVSRSELMKRNSLHNLPKELVQLVQLRGALNRKINERSKKQ
jgi:HNH endonuclease